MLIALRVPADNLRTPLFIEQTLAAIHRGNASRLPIQLLVASRAGKVGLFARFPQRLKPLVESQLFAQYPDAVLDQLADETLDPPSDWRAWTREVWLSPDLFPIRRYGQFEEGLERVLADPIASLLSAVTAANVPQRAQIELVIRPAGRRRPGRAHGCLQKLARPFFRTHPRLARYYARGLLSPILMKRLTARVLGLCARPDENQARDSRDTSTSRGHEREADLQAASDKLGRLLFEARLRLTVFAPATQIRAALHKLEELAGAVGQFSWPRLATFEVRPAREHPPNRTGERLPPFLLSTEEVASLWHPPTAGVRTATMDRVESRSLEPPTDLPRIAEHPQLAILGTTVFRSQRDAFGILPEDRLKHMLVIGRTGMGKTTLVQQLAISDIRAGRGVAWIDPHGDAIEELLQMIPHHRTNDVILFDAADTAHPIAFNPLECPSPAQRSLVASGLVTAMKRLFADSFGPRLQYILTNALLALTELPGATLVMLPRLLAEPGFRHSVVQRLSDPAVRAFFENEFEPMPARFRAEAISPVQNKIGAYLAHPILRNIVGQSRSGVNLRAAMDRSQVLLVNLSAGRIGDDASTLLGSLLITSLQVAALSRADTTESERREFHLFVDEAHRYTASSFSSMLAEARKYKASLCLATQALDQFDDSTRAAILGNVGSLIAFSVGPNDAPPLAEFVGAGLLPADLMALAKYEAYARLSITGRPSRPFSMATLPIPQTGDCQDPEVIRRTSRHRYARPIAIVERELRAAYQ